MSLTSNKRSVMLACAASASLGGFRSPVVKNTVWQRHRRCLRDERALPLGMTGTLAS